MERSQVEELYNFVESNWGLPEVSTKRKTQNLRNWRRFLEDLDYQETRSFLEGRAMSSGFPPKLGEIRAAVAANLPTPEEALVQTQRLSKAIQTGLSDLPETHPFVAEVYADIGLQKEETFMRLYRQRREDELKKYLPE